MNTVEHIVESYFRYCRGCLTISDVKVQKGNNRQCDLLAYNLKTHEQFHIESSVTILNRFQPPPDKLQKLFLRKFLGDVPKRKGERSDYAQGKNYYNRILETYCRVGFDPSKIQRIFVMWKRPSKGDESIYSVPALDQQAIAITIMSLRDDIIPALLTEIKTSHYDDEVLRTISIIRQYDRQRRRVAAI